MKYFNQRKDLHVQDLQRIHYLASPSYFVCPSVEVKNNARPTALCGTIVKLFLWPDAGIVYGVMLLKYYDVIVLTKQSCSSAVQDHQYAQTTTNS